MVFHCWQAGHFPTHFGLSWPQLRQKKLVLFFEAKGKDFIKIQAK